MFSHPPLPSEPPDHVPRAPLAAGAVYSREVVKSPKSDAFPEVAISKYSITLELEPTHPPPTTPRPSELSFPSQP